MKKLAVIFLSLAALVGCYDDYIVDYDYSSVYMAYQCDLRTFVVGEGMQFKIGAALGGVMDNGRDRNVEIAIVDSLCYCDLAQFNGLDEEGKPYSSFTALNVMKGSSTAAALSQPYVTEEFNRHPFNVKTLSPLPRNFYQVSSEDRMVIKKGMHTATITIKADSAAFLSDLNSAYPYFAIGVAIKKADADTILLSKSYEVVAVKYENMFFGNWYHGGVTKVVDDATGDVMSQSVYPTRIPGTDGSPSIYTLSTEYGKWYEVEDRKYMTLSTNFMGNVDGSVRIAVKDSGELEVLAAEGSTLGIEDNGSRFNGSKLLQGRKLFLNYQYSNNDGTTTVVTDTLTFRNRMRDGVNEWQDENPSHYN